MAFVTLVCLSCLCAALCWRAREGKWLLLWEPSHHRPTSTVACQHSSPVVAVPETPASLDVVNNRLQQWAHGRLVVRVGGGGVPVWSLYQTSADAQVAQPAEPTAIVRPSQSRGETASEPMDRPSARCRNVYFLSGMHRAAGQGACITTAVRRLCTDVRRHRAAAIKRTAAEANALRPKGQVR